jgi:transcriptional regulator GlxA family with amidase domain
MAGLPSARLVVLLAFPGVQALDLVGPMEVFAGASSMVAGVYDVQVVAPDPGELLTSSGLMVLPSGGLPDVPTEIDTLLVGGGPGTKAAVHDERLTGWLREAAGRSRRVASVCTGALLLARAGLLDGRHGAGSGRPRPCAARSTVTWGPAPLTTGHGSPRYSSRR